MITQKRPVKIDTKEIKIIMRILFVPSMTIMRNPVRRANDIPPNIVKET